MNDSLSFKSPVFESLAVHIHKSNIGIAFYTEQHEEELIFIYIFPFILFTPYRIWGEKGSLNGDGYSREEKLASFGT